MRTSIAAESAEHVLRVGNTESELLGSTHVTSAAGGNGREFAPTLHASEQSLPDLTEDRS
jgi:hypothetical protein